MYKITIPKPCHEDWNEMTTTQQGAFCNSCSKEVVNFTGMSDDEVRNYFLNKNTGNTCGHFRKEQIHRIHISLPENIFIQKIASWKKFMAIVLLAFGSMLFGCDVRTNEKANKEIITQKKLTIQLYDPYITQPPDTPPLLGTVALIIPDSSTCEKKQLDESPTIDGNIELLQIGTIDNETCVRDSIDYDEIFTGGVVLEKYDKIIDTLKRKPASDTNKCKDTGYY